MKQIRRAKPTELLIRQRRLKPVKEQRKHLEQTYSGRTWMSLTHCCQFAGDGARLGPGSS